MHIWLHIAIYTPMCSINAQEICATASKLINTKEAGAQYTKMI